MSELHCSTRSLRRATALVLACGIAVACTTAPYRNLEMPKPAAAVDAPLSAIAVSQCGQAVALFIQLDETHLFRADPRQSDMFVADAGRARHENAGPMKWEDAAALAERAVLSSHVTLPCTEAPTT